MPVLPVRKLSKQNPEGDYTAGGRSRNKSRNKSRADEQATR